MRQVEHKTVDRQKKMVGCCLTQLCPSKIGFLGAGPVKGMGSVLSSQSRFSPVVSTSSDLTHYVSSGPILI